MTFLNSDAQGQIISQSAVRTCISQFENFRVPFFFREFTISELLSSS